VTSIYPPGPEADLYLQHYQNTPSFRYAEQSWGEISPNWSELVLNGRAPTRTSIYPPGPEADPYLEHYQGTVSYRYGLPVALTASTWQLTDYAVVSRDGCATHTLGKHPVGYLMIFPERYVAMTLLDPTSAKVDQGESWEMVGGKLVLTVPATASGAYVRSVWEMVK
jgi:hypothetical protein